MAGELGGLPKPTLPGQPCPCVPLDNSVPKLTEIVEAHLSESGRLPQRVPNPSQVAGFDRLPISVVNT
ncbi:hypothetical protein GCM10009744_47800 [Kribbella alba]|uniref:Uncharacterized protein n=1 Tax=Kribbella alba TaxID=190197 RepID=A0ABN2FK15_9ACTN